ncbi:MAG: hypothetical protein ABEJ42_01360 [Halobacteriaceae archaeon]
MSEKLLPGSILTAAGLLAAVANAWSKPFFFALFHVGKGESLQGSGSFDPGPYADPAATEIFVVTRAAIWLVLIAGVVLLAWGVAEELRAD